MAWPVSVNCLFKGKGVVAGNTLSSLCAIRNLCDNDEIQRPTQHLGVRNTQCAQHDNGKEVDRPESEARKAMGAVACWRGAGFGLRATCAFA
jgi:hypothetical protein